MMNSNVKIIHRAKVNFFTDLWERISGPAKESHLAHLVHTHDRLVSLVRETEASYSLILQSYYGTAVRKEVYRDEILKLAYILHHFAIFI